MFKPVISFYTFFLIVLLSSCQSKNEATMDIIVKSPSQKMSVQINKVGTQLELTLSQNKVTTMHVNLDLNLGDSLLFKNDVLIKEITYQSKNNTWHPLYGERNEVVNHYNEATITLGNKSDDAYNYQVICRVYDEGFAFQYHFKGNGFKEVILQEEATAFHFDDDYRAWVTDRAQAEYIETNISKIENTVERPLVLKKNETTYFALGEAELVNYARAKFKKDPNYNNALKIDLDGEVSLKKAAYSSPWRFVMVAKSPAQLLANNYFIENLNAPNQIKDISWIKPGKILREVTLTTQGGRACVDFAVKHNLQYVEFDAGWYGNEYDDSSDAATVTVDPKRSPGPLDLHKIIAYGKEKGIGIILYVNRRAMEKQLDQILPLYKSWGIAGVKYGFVNVGPQEWTIWLHDAVRKAADHQLMVDIHDEYRPTGYSRTYPNLMTQEGIRGDEESPTLAQSLTTLFTRMLAGAADNTNCYFAARIQETMGGKSAQMAKSILLYSPWQFLYWYDRPLASPQKVGGAGDNERVLLESEELNFYDDLPTVWDKTHVLEGSIGAYATIARKHKNDWFIGSLTADASRQVQVPLEFLDKNRNYKATIYFQDAKSLDENKVLIENMEVTSQTLLNKNLLKNTGLTMVIMPVTNK